MALAEFRKGASVTPRWFKDCHGWLEASIHEDDADLYEQCFQAIRRHTGLDAGLHNPVSVYVTMANEGPAWLMRLRQSAEGA